MSEYICTCLPLPEPVDDNCPVHGEEANERLLAENAALKTRVAELEGALMPFVRYAKSVRGSGLVIANATNDGRYELLTKDFAKAARVFATPQKETSDAN